MKNKEYYKRTTKDRRHKLLKIINEKGEISQSIPVKWKESIREYFENLLKNILQHSIEMNKLLHKYDIPKLSLKKHKQIHNNKWVNKALIKVSQQIKA